MTETVQNPTEGQTAPAQGTPEYQQQMAARYDAAQGGKPAGGTDKPAVPEGQYEKYMRPDGSYDWQAHAREAEFKLQQRSQSKPEQNGNGLDDFIEKPKSDPNVVRDSLSEFNKAVASGDQNASREAAQKLIEMGIPKEILVQQAQATQMARQHQIEQSTKFVGETVFGDAAKGAEAVEQLRTWARANLSPEEQKEVAMGLQSPAWKSVVRDLATRMGSKGTVNVDMGAPASGSMAGFSSQQEMVAAMKDPRYQSDPTYREQVRQRVALMG